MVVIVDDNGNALYQFSSLPGMTHDLSWSIAHPDDGLYNTRIRRAIVLSSVSTPDGSTDWEELARVATTQTTYRDEHPFYVLGGRRLVGARRIFYEIASVRTATGEVTSVVEVLAGTYTLGTCA